MKYINATTILPDMLIQELQKYVQAGYIYIPAKDEQHKSWGELSGCRKELGKRNKAIIEKHRNVQCHTISNDAGGVSVKDS